MLILVVRFGELGESFRIEALRLFFGDAPFAGEPACLRGLAVRRFFSSVFVYELINFFLCGYSGVNCFDRGNLGVIL
jgi:hypothetical protein